MPLAKNLIEAAGNATQANYIEDVFSTYLYTGNGNSARSISNGIDLSTKGGMVWLKNRTNAYYNNLFDTARGVEKRLYSNTTDAQVTTSGSLTAFNTDGFSLGTASFGCNDSGNNIASWTFRKQPKFFTQGTFTGDGTTNKVITHDLNGTTGCIIVKRTDSTGNWQTWHRTFTAKQTIFLNTTDAKQTYSGADDITVTDNSFTVGTNQIFGNGSGFTYVYYVFAHDAGGFGLTGTDNVISCGSYTTDGSGNGSVTLGYEPQFVLDKITTVGDWRMFDNMRGIATGGVDARLLANDAQAESNANDVINLTSTGFTTRLGSANTTYIYIAIRRGPMKVPTDATKVYNAIARSGTGTTTSVTGVGFSPDLVSVDARNTSSGFIWQDKLRGPTYPMFPAITQAESLYSNEVKLINQDGITVGTDTPVNQSGINYINHFFQRAPSFFDEVCYTGTGSYPFTINHNLGVAPELIIFKSRSNVQSWYVYASPVVSPNANWYQNWMMLNATNAAASDTTSMTTAPTSSAITIAASLAASSNSMVAYLFATCAGVSKVTNFTGNGSSQTINCGFAAGARFVMIKRTDSTGDWFIFDTSRGIVSGNDPHLSLNTTAAEVTSDDTIDPDSTGFIVNQVAATNCNVNGASYIVLAIA